MAKKENKTWEVTVWFQPKTMKITAANEREAFAKAKAKLSKTAASSLQVHEKDAFTLD